MKISGFAAVLLLGVTSIIVDAQLSQNLGPSSSIQTKVLGPSGDVTVVSTDSNLDYLNAPSLAPSPAEQQVANATQADCISTNNVFWGADFLATKRTNKSSASDCCTACKLANDCTVWNWCSKEEGCALPPNLATANNATTIPFETCLWKPRPVTFAGTLPLPPEANVSSAMQGWTSGIPINGSLVPEVSGFQLYTGVELDYNVENDFYCQGSTTTKPVCQLYGGAQGGAAACLNNRVCRGYQICWSFPVWGSNYQKSGIIRMKAGLGPLNISSALQNPYCSVYVIDEDIFDNPNGSDAQYALRSAYNGTAAQEYYQYASQNPDVTANDSLSNLTANGIVSNGENSKRRLLQIVETSASPPANSSTGALIGTNLTSQIPSQTVTPNSNFGGFTAQPPIATSSSANFAPSAALTVSKPTVPTIVGSNFTTPFLAGTMLQAFNNVTFNYTQCYSQAATIRVTVQSQLFPFAGTTPVHSIHSWIEKPFSSSATVCCTFRDINDIFLNLETGAIAVSPPTYVATNPQITNGAPLRNYDTTPFTTLSGVVYVPSGLNNPSGDGRQWTFPSTNSTQYVSALEDLYFALAQVLLGDDACSFGNSQLAPAVDFLGQLLSTYTELEGENESPGGIPAGIEYLNASSQTDVPGPPVGCLMEPSAEFDGDLLTTITGNQTAATCCAACWFYSGSGNVDCDIWVLDTVAQSCQLKNNTLAANLQYVELVRDDSTRNLVTGRRTSIQPQNSTVIYQEQNY